MRYLREARDFTEAHDRYHRVHDLLPDASRGRFAQTNLQGLGDRAIAAIRGGEDVEQGLRAALFATTDALEKLTQRPREW